MPAMNGVYILLGLVASVGMAFLGRRWFLERGRGALRAMRPADLATGFVTDFVDTLGIGAFARTTAIFKLQRRMADEEIPGTLNVGHALPVVVEALIFIAIITFDFTTLVTMIAAALAGAWLGAGLVARAPRRVIQIGMVMALLVAAEPLLAKNLAWLSVADGNALGLSGGTLLFAVSINFLLGALMMIGVGLYASCLILVTLLGMSPLVVVVVIYAAVLMLMSARVPAGSQTSIPSRPDPLHSHDA